MVQTIRHCVCGRPTKNPKYCSVICCAKHGTAEANRRRRKNFCTCGQPKPDHRHQFCKDCRPKRRPILMTRTLAQVSEKAKYQVHAAIRGVARAIYTGQRSCKICNYSKHIQICHINPIASFLPDTLISVINADDNLVALCPTHHWELDHGQLDDVAGLLGLQPKTRL